MPRLFLSQDWVNQANVDDRVAVHGETLTVVADGRTYQIETAVHFLRVDGGDDTHQLVGSVKTAAQISALGGEIDRNSVIVNEEVAYTVEPGYAATFSGAGDPVSAAFR
jgi:hypothetical protein